MNINLIILKILARTLLQNVGNAERQSRSKEREVSDES